MDAEREMIEAMEQNPKLFEKAEELIKDHHSHKTPVKTSDGALLLLYTNEPLNDEEIAELSKLTAAEFRIFMRISNFKTVQI